MNGYRKPTHASLKDYSRPSGRAVSSVRKGDDKPTGRAGMVTAPASSQRRPIKKRRPMARTGQVGKATLIKG